MKLRLVLAATLLPLSACATVPAPAPAAAAGDEAVVIASLVARMSLERKVAQLIMPDIASITPADMRSYRFGSILNGGNSGPGGNDKAPPAAWLALADTYWEASTAPLPGDEPAIPALWATDAVHGHSNLGAATLFPHNIGLGAARDPALVQRIGATTAAEIATTGIDWTFAPTLAVATDDRWGRTYESFSEDPATVSALGEAMIRGLQGDPRSPGFLGQARVIATAKHFFADGGTGGKDRGDAVGDLGKLKRVHASPYVPAISAGVQTAMASFSSVNGEKMHGSRALLTDYLRGELGFDGVVVGDWNGHSELPGCSNADCPQALNAGLDIYMVPEDWKALHARLVAQVRDGTVPQTRLDEAVRRVLRLKQRYGLFTKPRPSARALAGRWELIGAPEHRALAREAARRSLILLKNDGVLPLKGAADILVAGAAADSIAHQSGGWSITWQGGGDLTNADFPGATSLYAGLAQAVAAGGGKAILSADGRFAARPDAAVVVFSEDPYAEFVGDRDDLALRDEEGLRLLRKFRAAGIPTVAVLLSGRPLWMGRELALADAFVAAWLPGSEGAGLADVIVGDAAGKPRHDFAGRLSFAWPAGCEPQSAAVFPLGFGGSYARPAAVPAGSRGACPLLNPDMSRGLNLFTRGLAPGITANVDGARLTNLVGRGGVVTVTGFDVAAQEDGRRIAWSGAGTLRFAWPARTLPAGGAVEMRYRVAAAPAGAVAIQAWCGESPCAPPVDLTSSFALAAGKDWRTLRLPLKCLDPRLGGLALSTSAPFTLELQSLRIIPQAGDDRCTDPF
ncbi:MAG: glycoside hydrolase family 3 N-terminal domain-containing protein [Novosphingobium sp.]|nr:glycoside hydrolase family 3 N-terminal domain-containing protein [Novosphingobium sp.]